MSYKKNSKEQLKTEIGKLVQSIVEISEKEDPPFYDQKILKLSEEIDELINTYYGIA